MANVNFDEGFKKAVLNYKDFYILADYLNEVNKGCFNACETACNANDYYMDYLYMLGNDERKIPFNIEKLLEIFDEEIENIDDIVVEDIIAELHRVTKF